MTFEQATAEANRLTKERRIYFTAIRSMGGGWFASCRYHADKSIKSIFNNLA